jgi:hypothetical protein
MSLRLQTRIAAAITCIGLAGALAMAYWESEPGALPLAVLLGGALWWFVSWRRLRAGARRGP